MSLIAGAPEAADAPRVIGRGLGDRRLLSRAAELVVAFGLLLAVWSLLSVLARPWVPTVTDTFQAAVDALRSGAFYEGLLITLRRVVLAFLVAGTGGALLGLAVGLSRRSEAFFLPLLAVALAIPDPVYIIFSILALGTSEMSAVVALTLAIAPFVTNIVRSSVDSRDRGLDDMAWVYGVAPRRALRHVLLPQLVPAFQAAARTSFALSWKIVVVVEALSRPDGIGAAIFSSFRLLRMREMVALAILFTIVMEVIERVVVAGLQARAGKGWRS